MSNNTRHSGRGARDSRGRGVQRNKTSHKRQEDDVVKIKSPIIGVDMLYPTMGTRETNLYEVLEQLADRCMETHGEVASFLKTGEYYERLEPEIDWEWISTLPTAAERKREKRRAEWAIKTHDTRVMEDREALPRIFAMMCQTLSKESKETLSTSDTHDDVMDARSDPLSLREIMISTHTSPRVGSEVMARMEVQERLRSIKMPQKGETLTEYKRRVLNAHDSFTVHGLEPISDEELAIIYLKGLNYKFRLYTSRRFQNANDGTGALPTDLASAHSQALIYSRSAQYGIDQSQMKGAMKA